MVDPTYGLDIAFDLSTGLQGAKDVQANDDNDDFALVTGPLALAQELQRLFDLTPWGSFLEDDTYGCSWDAIGSAVYSPQVVVTTTRVAALRALSHPSLKERFTIRKLEASWSQREPQVVRVWGVLRLSSGTGGLYGFGPYVARFS